MYRKDRRRFGKRSARGHGALRVQLPKQPGPFGGGGPAQRAQRALSLAPSVEAAPPPRGLSCCSHLYAACVALPQQLGLQASQALRSFLYPVVSLNVRYRHRAAFLWALRQAKKVFILLQKRIEAFPRGPRCCGWQRGESQHAKLVQPSTEAKLCRERSRSSPRALRRACARLYEGVASKAAGDG